MAYAVNTGWTGVPGDLVSADGTAQESLEYGIEDETAIIATPVFIALPAGGVRMVLVRALFYRSPGRLTIPSWSPPAPTDFSTFCDVKFDAWLVGQSSVKTLSIPTAFAALLEKCFQVQDAFETSDLISQPENEIYASLSATIPFGVAHDLSYWPGFGIGPYSGIVNPSTPLVFNNLDAVQSDEIVKRPSQLITGSFENHSTERPYLVHPATHFPRKDRSLSAILADGVTLGLGTVPDVPGFLRMTVATPGPQGGPSGSPGRIEWNFTAEWSDFVQEWAFGTSANQSLREDTSYLSALPSPSTYPYVWSSTNASVALPEDAEWEAVPRFEFEWAEGIVYAATDWGRPVYCRDKLLSYGFTLEDLAP
jgi:hypothetical protein